MLDGYWKAPEKTAEALRGGAFHTGDGGYIDEAGFVYVSGRRSELIVSGGMNVYPAEIERVLLGHPAVDAAAVFGVPHERWGEGVGAAIVLRRGASIDDAGIVAHCRSELASYKKPTRVWFVEELPLTAGRKIDKRALRAKLTAKR
jgi:acyl-CoA synthetase (AMP-forming)/AMP-acid ligase II